MSGGLEIVFLSTSMGLERESVDQQILSEEDNRRGHSVHIISLLVIGLMKRPHLNQEYQYSVSLSVEKLGSVVSAL
jgi:hypothetical protein